MLWLGHSVRYGYACFRKALLALRSYGARSDSVSSRHLLGSNEVG